MRSNIARLPTTRSPWTASNLAIAASFEEHSTCLTATSVVVAWPSCSVTSGSPQTGGQRAGFAGPAPMRPARGWLQLAGFGRPLSNDLARADPFGCGEGCDRRLPGRGALAGEHRGRGAVIAAIQALLARTSDSSAEVEVLDRLVSGDRVAMVLREAVFRGEKRLELRRVNVYRVEAGKIVEIDIYEANQDDVDAFFG